MPKIPFDFRKITPKNQVSGAVAESLSPYQQNIQAMKQEQQSNRQLASSVLSAVGTGAQIYGQYTEEQDSSDMVAARAAILRLNQDENQAIASTSDPAQIERIGNDYNKKYDEIMSGSDPAHDRPYFRNQSGKDKFKTAFQDQFNLGRQLSADKSIYNLDRRNTSANLENGIKSARSASYYDQPQAEVETLENIDRLIEFNYLTPAEGVERKRVSLISLDTERASRKLTDLNPGAQTDFNGSGAINPINMQVSQYKEYVEGLKHLTPQQKAGFNHKADSIQNTAKVATRLANSERNAKIKQLQRTTDNDFMLSLAERKITLSDLLARPEISQDLRKTLIGKRSVQVDEYYKANEKAVKTEADKVKVAGEKAIANDVTSYALRFDRESDPTGKEAAHIITQIGLSPAIPSETQAYLIGIVKNGRKMTPGQEAKRKNYIQNIDRIMGLTDDSFKEYLKNPWGMKGAKATEEGGIKTVDGLSEYQRRDAVNGALQEYDYLQSQGKIKEADDSLNKFMIDFEKSDDDTTLYNDFVKRSTIYKQGQ